MRNIDRYEIVVEKSKSWFAIDWKGMLHYRDLLFLLVRRDFVAKYKQTILGPLWFVAQPLLTTTVLTVVFSRIAKISTDTLPPFLFYLCGIMIWNYFANCFTSTATSFVDNAHIFGKVYFPRIIIPAASVISNAFTFCIQLVTFLGFYVFFKFFTPAGGTFQATNFIWMLPLLFLQTALFSLGLGLWFAALTAKYRDLAFLMAFLLQLWMYATPVIYPVSVIPAQWRFILAVNPMAAIIDLYRYAFFGTLALGLKYLALSVCTTVVVFISGFLVFNKVERTVIDTV